MMIEITTYLVPHTNQNHSLRLLFFFIIEVCIKLYHIFVHCCYVIGEKMMLLYGAKSHLTTIIFGVYQEKCEKIIT